MGSQASSSVNVDGMMMGSDLKCADEIKSFPYFPSGTKSLLSKVLTREVWDACKDKKDKFGFTF